MDMYDQSRFLICFDFPYPLCSPLIFPPFPEKKKATAAMIVHKAKNPFLRDMSELPFRFDDLWKSSYGGDNFYLFQYITTTM